MTNPALGSTATVTATCPPGKQLFGGGANVSTAANTGTGPKVAPVAALGSSYPADMDDWAANATVTTVGDSKSTVTVTAYAVCTV